MGVSAASRRTNAPAWIAWLLVLAVCAPPRPTTIDSACRTAHQVRTLSILSAMVHPAGGHAIRHQRVATGPAERCAASAPGPGSRPAPSIRQSASDPIDGRVISEGRAPPTA